MRPISLKSSFLATSRFLAVLTLVLAGLLTAASAQTPVTLYNFNGTSDVATPVAPGFMPQGRDGNLYSVTVNGGAFHNGGIFAITPTGTESVLHSFPINAQIGCGAGLTLASDGNFYGSCTSGGANGYGLLYKVTPGGVFTDLHDFAYFTDGANPNAPPMQAKDGNFYGSIPTAGPLGHGLIYKLTPTGTFSIVYSFNGSSGGYAPLGSLVQGTDGNLYGTTALGGAIGDGTVFKVSTTGHLTYLHNFTGTDGNQPYAALIQGADGKFYGTTGVGGATNNGVVFRITSSGSYTLLHSLLTATEGQNPRAALVQATDGNFYGVTESVPGSLFKVTPQGVFSVVYLFDGTSNTLGTEPASSLVQNTNGILYGDLRNSAANQGNGSVYTLNIGSAPFVRLTLTAGKVASTVSLFGQGFGLSSVVKFGGVPATVVTLAGSTYITATVPAGAHSGAVTVTTGSTTLTSNLPYKVTPAITTFSPTTGPVGTSVVIHGSGFIQATAVKFGTKAATSVTVNSDSQVTALVPAGSAPGQVKIAITTPGGTATSAAKFTVQ
jgi:uncharacterized repeat protein (TIGR03803 family)